MIIETERLRLRPFENEDAEWLFEVTHHDDVKQWLGGAYSSFLKDAINSIKFYYSKADFIHDFYFVMEEKKTQERIGFLNITQGFKGELEVAMVIIKNHRGKGYVAEAVKGFSKRVSGRILEFCIDRENEASLKAVEKIEGIAEKTFAYPEYLTKDCRYFVLET